MLIVATVKYITAFVKIKPILISWEDHPGGSIVEYDCTGIQFSSVTQSCPTLCNPMDCSTPGLPVHHQLTELAQTHVHQVSDAIQPSRSLSSPSPPLQSFPTSGSFPMSQFFTSGDQGIGASASDLPTNVQD